MRPPFPFNREDSSCFRARVQLRSEAKNLCGVPESALFFSWRVWTEVLALRFVAAGAPGWSGGDQQGQRYSGAEWDMQDSVASG